jgi:hypothetical protein
MFSSYKRAGRSGIAESESETQRSRFFLMGSSLRFCHRDGGRCTTTTSLGPSFTQALEQIRRIGSATRFSPQLWQPTTRGSVITASIQRTYLCANSKKFSLVALSASNWKIRQRHNFDESR